MAVADEVAYPQMVGNAFVEQYYSILHKQPEIVFRFYQETSVLSRPEEDGTMSLVTTVKAINEKILSRDHTKFGVQILSADCQSSYKNGVMVAVTGCLTGDNDLKRKFAQLFFLASQAKGFIVLNDVFRYIDDHKPVDSHSVPANDADESAPAAFYPKRKKKKKKKRSAPAAPLTPEPEPFHVPENIPPSQAAVVDTDIDANKEVNQQLDDGVLSVTEKEVDSDAVKETSQQESHPVIEKTAPSTQEDAPKKSFASIMNALKDNAAPFYNEWTKVKREVKEKEELIKVLKLQIQDTRQDTMREVEEISQELEEARNDADIAKNEWTKVKREVKVKEELIKVLKLQIQDTRQETMRQVEEISQELEEARNEAEHAQNDADIAKNEWIKAKKDLQQKLELIQILKLECQEASERAKRQVEEKELELADTLNAVTSASSSFSVAQDCAICLTNEKDLAFGCGHVTCEECGKTLSTCPICRKRITIRIKLFP